jgi:hypothetical protein
MRSVDCSEAELLFGVFGVAAAAALVCLANRRAHEEGTRGKIAEAPT